MGLHAHACTRPKIAAASLCGSHSGSPLRLTRDRSRHRVARLAAALALALNLPGQATAGVVTVTRCNDQDGIQYFGNSLRLAINIAVDGDTVDLGGLACSTITLERGELYVDKNLTLSGPADHTLTVDANSASRVIDATANLNVYNLRLTHGFSSGSGGCVLSAGSVKLVGATITGCTSSLLGGGVRASALEANYSTISGNSASGRSGGAEAGSATFFHSSVTGNLAASGGGVGSSSGPVTVRFSSISGNQVAGTGGGIYSQGDVNVYDSVVAGNTAYSANGGIDAENVRLERSTVSDNLAHAQGGLRASTLYAIASTINANLGTSYRGGGEASTATFVNSTISGNGGGCVGGFASTNLVVRNSTIAFNYSESASPYCTGGMLAHDAQIISSILAKNTRSGIDAADLLVRTIDYDPGSLTAATSLIMSSNKPSLSLTADPLLGPLADHGGSVRVHALLPNSPAINAGSNPNSLPFDARGAGFPRSALGGVDIGAYERQLADDILFADGFE